MGDGRRETGEGSLEAGDRRREKWGMDNKGDPLPQPLICRQFPTTFFVASPDNVSFFINSRVHVMHQFCCLRVNDAVTL